MKRYLILENHMIFEGEAIGSLKNVTGELVFTTGMNGYIETLTDPSYYGQIVIQTFPLIGNYGMISDDMESDKPYLFGYIISNMCETPSNFRCEERLNDYLLKNDIPGIANIDTRYLTKIIRSKGTMNARITNDINDFLFIADYKIINAIEHVSSKDIKHYNVDDPLYNVCLYDFGAKRNIIRELNKRKCNVISLPYNTTSLEVLKINPDGIMLSNGPGDPSENIEIIEELKKLMGKKPIFGICLGHQLLALANGALTTKLKYGHRGVNQPVKSFDSNKVYISSQNHGYAVIADSINPKMGYVSFVNVNDSTVEGIKYYDNAFTVQFHPEACSGPQDTKFLFDDFIKMLGGNAHASR